MDPRAEAPCTWHSVVGCLRQAKATSVSPCLNSSYHQNVLKNNTAGTQARTAQGDLAGQRERWGWSRCLEDKQLRNSNPCKRSCRAKKWKPEQEVVAKTQNYSPASLTILAKNERLRSPRQDESWAWRRRCSLAARIPYRNACFQVQLLFLP